MTVDEIRKALFFKKEAYFLDMFGKVKCNQTTLYSDRNNCTDRQHIEKWLAINDLLTVAKYVNQSWNPDWGNKGESKYAIVCRNGKFVPEKTDAPSSIVYFRSVQDTLQVIETVGEKLLEEIFF
ncbi:MAG: hypothetical protein J5701_00720 [Bacteroidales bacterium]|nr:hypothetical protein [Bacteroidales bacterium]